MSTGDPICMLHGRLIPCADCVARSMDWIPVRNYGDATLTPCENCRHALSQRDRWHSEAKRIGDNYEQAVRDLDEQRRENDRCMGLLGQALRSIDELREERDAAHANIGRYIESLERRRVELERLRPVYEAAIECHRGESIVIDYQRSCPLCRDRDTAPTCDAHAQYAHAATAATEQLGIAIDAATTKPEAGK